MNIYKLPYGLLIVLLFLVSACNRPISNFTINAEDLEAPSRVSFVNESENAETYFWEFGDGNTSTEKDPMHRYISSGNYEIQLTSTMGKKKTTTQKQLLIKAPEKCMIEIETNHGTMIAVLYDETPLHRDNFSKLAEEGFFNDLLFHRVISGFMIQGGDPQSKGAPAGAMLGSGGPGYTIPAEFNEKFIHKKGALAAARQGDNVNPKKESSGSQFYIVHGTGPMEDDAINQWEARMGTAFSDENRKAYKEMGGTPFLDQNYTVFGEIVEGLDVIDKIAAVQTARGDRPQEDVKMTIRLIK